MRNQLLIILCCLCSLPIFPIFAEVSVQQLDNKTFMINITSINPIEINQDNSEIESTLQQIMENNNGWSKGDLIIASATIFAFFTFGSILIVKFQGKIDEELELMDIILASTFTIQIIHLLAILSIVSGYPVSGYSSVILVTIVLMLIIGIATRKMFRLENRADTTEKYFDTILSGVLKEKGMEDAYFDLRRKYQKDLKEMGE